MRRNGVLTLGAIVVAALAGITGLAIGYALADGNASVTGFEKRADVLLHAPDSPDSAGTDTAGATASLETTLGLDAPATPNELNEAERELVSRLPADQQQCVSLRKLADFAESPAAVACITEDGGPYTLYDQVLRTVPGSYGKGDLNRYYDALLEMGDLERDAGDKPCSKGSPAEREWVDREISIGRVACFEQDGKPSLLWMHEPLQIVAFTTAPEDMTNLGLYEWWARTSRPGLLDEEVAFIGTIPENLRASCTYYGSFEGDYRPPILQQGDCYDRLNEDDLVFVAYASFSTTEAMSASYDEYRGLRKDWAGRDMGTCPNELPSEEPRKQSREVIGRIACHDDLGPVMTWTTDPLKMQAWATEPDYSTMSMAEFYKWWLENGGPIYSPSG